MSFKQRLQQLRSLQDAELRKLGKLDTIKKWYHHKSYVGKEMMSALDLVGGDVTKLERKYDPKSKN